MRYASLSVLAAASFIGTSACSNEPSTAPRTLDEARGLWQARQIDDYSFVRTKECACKNGTVPARLVIEADTVREAVWLDDGRRIPDLEQEPSAMEDFFGLVERYQARPEVALHVTYDAADGHVNAIRVTSAATSDIVVGYTITDFQARASRR